MDSQDQQSDESFQFLHLSPPRPLDDGHAEPDVVENIQIENATIAESLNPFPIDEYSVDDLFDLSPLNLEGENTRVENPSDGFNPNLSVNESGDDFFDFSPLELEGENKQVENPSEGFNPNLSVDESIDDFFVFSPLNLEGESKQVENPSEGFDPSCPVDVSVDDDFFDVSPLNLERESKQVENPSEGFDTNFPVDESFDFDFDFSTPAVQGEHAEWTFDENKEFENALAEFDPSSQNFFEDLASRVPSKSIDEIKTHYEDLVHDIESIEAGKIELPDYLDDQQSEQEAAQGGDGEGGSSSKEPQGPRLSAAEKKKRKGSAWTEEEHKNFLKGLAEYGRGDWRSISRVHVLSKTPTQIASHAQKFYRRQENPKKSSAGAATSSTYPYPRKSRSSIHDIAKVVTPTTTITIPTLPPKPDTTPQQPLHISVPSAPLTDTIIDAQSFPPPISSSTIVSIPPPQRSDEEAPNFPPLAFQSMTLPPWVTSTTIATTTFMIPPRPRGRPRYNFNPRARTDQRQAAIPLPLMHRNLTLPSRITSSTTPTTALLPPRPPRRNFNIPARPTTQLQAAISPLMSPRPAVSNPSMIRHHFNPAPQTDHDHDQQRQVLPPFPECFNVEFPPVSLMNTNIPPDPELPPLPYCNVPFPPPLTSGTPAMDPPPFEETQRFHSFNYRSSVDPGSTTTTTVSTTISDPGTSGNGQIPSSSSSSHPAPTENWFWPN